MRIVVAGIHTGIGKTICSAVLCKALGADYWKPVQAGDLDQSDSITMRRLSGDNLKIHPEKFRLRIAASPHYAASQEGQSIRVSDFQIPDSENLVIETAGGILSPLSEAEVNLDLIRYFDSPVVLVSKDYLGSINHTLMSVRILQQENIPLAGLVFCGEENAETRRFIQSYTRLPVLFHIPEFKNLDVESISNFSASLASTLKSKF